LLSQFNRIIITYIAALVLTASAYRTFCLPPHLLTALDYLPVYGRSAPG
jgi:hypothetical protein